MKASLGLFLELRPPAGMGPSLCRARDGQGKGIRTGEAVLTTWGGSLSFPRKKDVLWFTRGLVYSFIHFQEVIRSSQVDISRCSQEMERNEPEISEAHKIDVLGTEMVTT